MILRGWVLLRGRLLILVVLILTRLRTLPISGAKQVAEVSLRSRGRIVIVLRGILRNVVHRCLYRLLHRVLRRCCIRAIVRHTLMIIVILRLLYRVVVLAGSSALCALLILRHRIVVGLNSSFTIETVQHLLSCSHRILIVLWLLIVVRRHRTVVPSLGSLLLILLPLRCRARSIVRTLRCLLNRLPLILLLIIVILQLLYRVVILSGSSALSALLCSCRSIVVIVITIVARSVSTIETVQHLLSSCRILIVQRRLLIVIRRHRTVVPSLGSLLLILLSLLLILLPLLLILLPLLLVLLPLLLVLLILSLSRLLLIILSPVVVCLMRSSAKETINHLLL